MAGDSLSYMGLEKPQFVRGSREMVVPKQSDLYRPILEIAADSEVSLSPKQFFGEITIRLALTADDLQDMVPSGAKTRVETRIYWAITNLIKAELLHRPQPGHLQITGGGRQFLSDHSGNIREAELKQLWTESSAESETTEVAPDPDDITPEEQLDRSYKLQQEQLTEEILNSLKGVPPGRFERLVVGLLGRMGYGYGQVTGKSGDQGIDGILSQNTLGLERVYVQAKRYDSNSIGEPEIRIFAGSLDGQGAAKGVFITTSTFSDTARQMARNISLGSKSIRLIDGRELAQMMIKHNVGVFTTITYEVKKLDTNYFAEV